MPCRPAVAKESVMNCSNAHRYKAMRPPRCLAGRICDSCRRKWRKRMLALAGELDRAVRAYGALIGAMKALKKLES